MSARLKNIRAGSALKKKDRSALLSIKNGVVPEEGRLRFFFYNNMGNI